MAGDIGVSERLVIPGAGGMLEATAAEPILHEYGPNVMIAMAGEPEPQFETEAAAPPLPQELSETEQLGVEALQLRLSDDYRVAKEKREYRALSWGAEEAQAESLHPYEEAQESGFAAAAEAEEEEGEVGAEAPPTSDRLKGRVAVGIIMVSGPGTLALSPAERVKIVAEIQNGLGWLGAQSPAKDVTFVYEIHHVSVTAQQTASGTTYEQFERPWRDAAMAKLGFGPGMNNVLKYVNALRQKLATQRAYCTFFTKYRLKHFAYASVGGPRLVMHFANDGWGVDNIDRVFAHETGHIFGAPDEYATSNCGCGGAWGFFQKPNKNCANCAPGGGVSCIMRSNEWSMCEHTKLHLGF